MVRLAEIIDYLERFAPTSLAEEWDNVGLLVGDRTRDVESVLTCLTLTPDVAAEAVEQGAQLVVSHHPLMFRPVKRIVADDIEGATLLQLIGAGVGVYSPHTSYDSAVEGINSQLAETLELRDVGILRPLLESATVELAGGGRFGTLPSPVSLSQFVQTVRAKLALEGVQYVGEREMRVERVAVACGAAAEFLADARRQGCQALVTGEARFHACLEARSLGMALVLAGHYATERPGVEQLATILSRQFPKLRAWASRHERDPIQWA